MTNEEVVQEIKGGIKMTKIDWEKCIDLANKRLRDVITAANNADADEMESLMMSSMCGEDSEFMKNSDEEQTELTLNGDQTNGIYFKFQGYNFHITKDSEYNNKLTSDLYHVWCECKFFDNEKLTMGLIYINWFCGGDIIEDMHHSFLAGKISEKKFTDYIYNDLSFYLRDWLEKNKEKIGK